MKKYFRSLPAYVIGIARIVSRGLEAASIGAILDSHPAVAVALVVSRAMVGEFINTAEGAPPVSERVNPKTR